MRRFCALVLVGLAGWTLAFAAAEPRAFSERQRNWWSLKPIVQPDPPAVKARNWVATPVDAFVLAKLEAAGIAPNPRADRRTLLRRATIDLTGLLPTEQQIQEFQSDTSPDAWSTVVDRLLASPAYGERWGRHWLDVARYADSNGFKADETRPHIWRYRDYVVKAFNDDKPYDQFIREQIAGDELFPGSPEALVAMGFNRHWIDETNAAGLLLRRQETIDEMTNATGAVFLGMTVACARCHDHKFDPILQKDYYRLQAFFANTVAGDGPLPLSDPAERRAYDAKKAEWEAKTADIRAEMSAILEPIRISRAQSGSNTFEDEVKAAIFMEPAKRDPFQAVMAKTAEPRVDLADDPDARTLRTLEPDAAARYAELKKQLASFDAIKPDRLDEGQFMVDLSATAPPTYLLKGGNLQAKQEEVKPGFLTILDAGDAAITSPAGLNSTGRRSALAAWLTDVKNPLPARVMVNRVWHYHFGRGIAATPGDLGLMGSRPTHPELLDYLASTFQRGWSIKALHRTIMLSNTYQQSSATTAASAKADPDNKLLWRYQRRRMEAEAVRDTMLQVSGLLNSKMGGPGVFPPLPPGTISELSATAAAGGWRTETDPSQSNRRSVYVFVRRNLRYPMLQDFDLANTFESHAARTNTVTASQSLDLMNNDLMLDWARGLAGRAVKEAGPDPLAQVDRAFRLAYGRRATQEEQELITEFLERQMPILAERFAKGGKAMPALPADLPDGADKVRAAALVDLSHMLLSSNEFLYIE
jgi:hypothetical protein